MITLTRIFQFGKETVGMVGTVDVTFSRSFTTSLW